MLPTNPLLNATSPAGPHLPVGLLRQYAAGTLAPATQHRVEAHTLACPRCADILAGLQQTLPATTDQALAQLQQRLRQRVQQQAAPARYDRETHRNRWLIPQLAAAAALLLGLVAGGWWAWQQRHAERAAPIAAKANAPIVPAPATPPLAAVVPPAAPDVLPPVPQTPARVAAPKALRQPLATRARAGRAASKATLADAQATITTSEPPVAAAPPAATVPAAPVANAPTTAADSARPLAGRVSGMDVRKAASLPEAAPRRQALMPAAPPIAPAPVGGYSALREKLRRAATEFQPEEGERPVSGSVQLRLTIGADGKIEQIKVVHGLRADYDEEAQRLVCDGPGWIPGISGGRRAAQTVDIAVPF